MKRVFIPLMAGWALAFHSILGPLFEIMVSIMITCNAGRRTDATRGGGTSEQDGREGERTGDQARSGKGGQGSGRAQVGNNVNNQGNNGNQNDNVINDNTHGNVWIANINNKRGGCSYKEFLACYPKDYDVNGGVIVYTYWIEKMESVQDMSGCGENQKVKYTSSLFIGKALTWWNSQVQNRGQKAAIGMTWEEFKVMMREELCPNNEMQKLEAEFWCHAMVGAGHATYPD
ncbi:reverse transcriptase domain-containing protein [Tanacetum coccineum]